MEWHDDEGCRRLDLESIDGIDTCLSCGSVRNFSAGPFEPPPVKVKGSEIRILQIRPGEPEDDIQCFIFTRDLDARPDYEALSYTWADETGDDTLCKTIFISSQPFRVTRNCEAALKAIRNREYYSRDVWVDAICINQENVTERNHQVQLMSRIYSTAQKVLIYAGEPTPRLSACLEALLLSARLRWGDMRNPLEGFQAEVKQLLARRYFSRVWILQEVMLSRQADLILGRYVVPWRLFRSQLHSLARGISLPPALVFSHDMYSTPGQFLNLLDFAKTCHAGDPRDKVYALLGLALDVTQDGFIADYNLDTRQLYSKVADYLAQKHGWMPILLRAGPYQQSVAGLDPWVPDWSRPHDGEGHNLPAMHRTYPYPGVFEAYLWIEKDTAVPDSPYVIYEENRSGKALKLRYDWVKSVLRSDSSEIPMLDEPKHPILLTGLPPALYFMFPDESIAKCFYDTEDPMNNTLFVQPSHAISVLGNQAFSKTIRNRPLCVSARRSCGRKLSDVEQQNIPITEDLEEVQEPG